jgi:hypothetical protein
MTLLYVMSSLSYTQLGWSGLTPVHWPQLARSLGIAIRSKKEGKALGFPFTL